VSDEGSPARRTQIAAAILALLTAACSPDDDPARLELLLQDPLEFQTPADRCEAELCTRLLDLIRSAERSIDFAIYGARDQTALLEAILDARDRGVRVRGLVDADPRGGHYYASTEVWVRRIGDVRNDRAREPAPNGSADDYRPPCPRPPGFDGPLQCLAYDLGDRWLLAEHASSEDFVDPELGGVNRIMHHKFFVVDGRYVWTGSANISSSGTGGTNANAAILADSRELADLYTAEFERMRARRSPADWKSRDGVERLEIGGDEVTVWFSPQDDAMRFGAQGLIARAERSVDVAVFYLTNKWVTAELIAAARRGVAVRVIVDATSAGNGYTKHELLRVAGVPVKVENWGGKMHMKAAVIDGEFLIVGSMNWTRAGEDTNDENTLLIRSPRLASTFATFFDLLWDTIPDPWAAPGARPDPESRESPGSCRDGVDNDFDERVDDDDEGCSPGSVRTPLPPHRVVAKSGPEPPRTHRLYRPTTCDPGYPDWFVCVPRRPPARDLDCRDIPYRRFTVRAPDPHGFDPDGDGVGCEGVGFGR